MGKKITSYFSLTSYSPLALPTIMSVDNKLHSLSMTSCHRRCCSAASVLPNSVRSQRLQPTRLPHPGDSPGKNTAVGCHFLLQCRKVKRESEVAQSYLTLSDPMDRLLIKFSHLIPTDNWKQQGNSLTWWFQNPSAFQFQTRWSIRSSP